MTLEPVQRTSLPEAVAQKILRLIRKGQLKPGDCLPSQKELMTQMGVGRSSVREAVQRLIHLNVLASYAGRGTFVNEIPKGVAMPAGELSFLLAKDAIAELIEVRTCLEIRAAILAAQQATPDDLKAMEEALKKFEAATLSGQFTFAFNADFHIALAAASHNETLFQLISEAIDAVYALRKESETVLSGGQDDRLKAFENHRKIYNAVREKKSDVAQRWMEEHFEFARILLERERSKS